MERMICDNMKLSCMCIYKWRPLKKKHFRFWLTCKLYTSEYCIDVWNKKSNALFTSSCNLTTCKEIMRHWVKSLCHKAQALFVYAAGLQPSKSTFEWLNKIMKNVCFGVARSNFGLKSKSGAAVHDRKHFNMTEFKRAPSVVQHHEFSYMIKFSD